MTEIAVDDALFGAVLSPRVQQIIRLEREAEDSQWEAARLIAEELADGKTQVQLACEIGKSQGHVSKMNSAWKMRCRYSLENIPQFQDVYRELSSKSQPESKPNLAQQPQLPESGPEPSGRAEKCGTGEFGEEPEEEQPKSDSPPSAEGESDTADDPGPGEPDAPPAPSSVGGEPEPEVPLEPAIQGTRSHPSTAREKLARLREMADEAERANPYVPIRELVDVRDALRRAVPKMRTLRNAGHAVGADGLVAGIASLYKELEELL